MWFNMGSSQGETPIGSNRDVRDIFLTVREKGRLPRSNRDRSMTLNGSGVRISSVFGVSSATVIDVLKKEPAITQLTNALKT